MRPYPSSFFIQLSNMYCTPTGKRAAARDLSLTDRYFYAKIIFTKRGLSSKKGHGFCGRGGMADALVLGASTSVCGFKSHRPHQKNRSGKPFLGGLFLFYHTWYRTHPFSRRLRSSKNSELTRIATWFCSPSNSWPYVPKVSIFREWPTKAFTSPSGRFFTTETKVCRSS